MLLAIDAGNSTINVGLFGEEKKLLFLASLETDRRKTRDQFCVDLMNLFALYHYELKDVQGAILCSVVPALDAVLEEALTRLLGRKPIVVGPGAVTGLTMRVTMEYQVGADIIADAVGALEKFEPPIIVIDMGTATTINVISKSGVYEGGLFLPGVDVALESMSHRAALLPDISLRPPKGLIGKDSEECMLSGIVYGNAAMLDGLIDRICEMFQGEEVSVVATGGNAPQIIRYCRHVSVHDPHLLMEGLWHIYRKNR